MRQAFDAQTPPGYIHFMHTLIADIAIAGIPEPVPVVLQAQLIESAHGGRAQELIPIDTGWHGAIRLVADGRAALEAEAFRQIDLADHAFMQKLNGLHLVFHGAALRTDLYHAAVFASSRHHLRSFERVVAGRLFYVDILTGLHGPDGGECVPVIRQGHGNSLDGLIVKHLTHIGIAFRLGPGGLFDQRLAAFERGLIDVADGCDVGIGKLGVLIQVGPATAA